MDCNFALLLPTINPKPTGTFSTSPLFKLPAFFGSGENSFQTYSIAAFKLVTSHCIAMSCGSTPSNAPAITVSSRPFNGLAHSPSQDRKRKAQIRHQPLHKQQMQCSGGNGRVAAHGNTKNISQFHILTFYINTIVLNFSLCQQLSCS